MPMAADSPFGRRIAKLLNAFIFILTAPDSRRILILNTFTSMRPHHYFAIFLLAAAAALLHYGGYGVTLFAAIPMLLGALGAYVRRSKTYGNAAWVGAVASGLASLCLVLFKAEGLICVLMALPLTGFCGAIGGMAYLWMSSPQRARAAFMLIPLPLATSLGFDLTSHSPVYETTTSIEINAPAERVWQNVVAFPDLAAPGEFYFKAGLAYPTRTRIVGEGVGAKRFCDMSTGSAVETVTVWEPGRTLEFEVTETPAAMEELSPYGHIEPKHLHGYFLSKRGRFQLTSLPGGRTRVDGTSWYQHGLYPAQYWRVWTDATIHQVHIRVLHHIRELSENRSPDSTF